MLCGCEGAFVGGAAGAAGGVVWAAVAEEEVRREDLAIEEEVGGKEAVGWEWGRHVEL